MMKVFLQVLTETRKENQRIDKAETKHNENQKSDKDKDRN